MGSKILLILMLGASAFDVGTTEYGLRRGARELSPLTTNRSVRIAVNVVAPIALWQGTKQMSDKARIGVCLGYVGTKTAVSIYNIWKVKQITSNTPVALTPPHLQKNFFSLEDNHERVYFKSN